MNNIRFIKFMVLCCVLQLSVACNHEKKENNEQNLQITVSGDTINVPENSPSLAKISYHTVTRQEYYSQSTTTGTVKTLTGHLAEVSTPFDGRIVRSYVRLGERVSAGTQLFEINSSDYFDAVKSFLQAKKSKQLTEKNFQRKKDLLDHGIGSQKDFEDAEWEYTTAQKEYEKAEATIRIFNKKPDDADLSQPLIVRSPIAGEIVRNNITVGQYLKTDSDPVLTVADLEKVWVIARVKEKNIGLISQKDNVQIFTESYPDKPLSGFVDYIGDMMDEQTRSVEVYIECENHEKIMKPGMFVTVNFEHKIDDAMIIPSSSVLQQEDKSFLFIKKGNNRFIKKEVTVSSAGDKNLIVYKGLEAGDVIVSDGGIYLR